jgi:uncharacterized membrane protein YidH (DUF202 family)
VTAIRWPWRHAPTHHRQVLMRRVGRAGYAAYGAIHLLVAWLAVQIAFGGSGRSADAGGALATLAGAAFGRVLLAILTVGLLLLTLWRLAEAVWGEPGHGDHPGTKRRLTSIAQAICFAALTATTARTVLSDRAPSSGHSEQRATSTALSLPGGRFLVGAIGVGVVALGIGMLCYGLLRRFERAMQLDRLGHRARRAVLAVGAVGHVAKGVAYGIVGVLLTISAVTYQPHHSRGLDQALRVLAGQPHGRVLLCLVAFGIGCFGVLCFVRARYQRR